MSETTEDLSPIDVASETGGEHAVAWRIVDANANRAVEGLRVTEDYLRFHREDAFLAQMCKRIRHQVSETLTTFGRQRLASRSTETDVGTDVGTESEYQRSGLQHIAIANMRRACEAMRTLEEYSKVLSLSAAKAFEALRYQTYTLEKAIGHLEFSSDVLCDANIYVIVDLQYGVGDEFISRVRHLVAGGVGVIQLRDKSADDRALISAGHTLKNIIRETNVTSETPPSKPLLIMNDRPDIARVVHADGVHVGQDELRVAETRVVVGPEKLIGVSTHNLEQAKQAVVDGADYIGVGPVFESSTKSFSEFVGVELLENVATEIALPAYAIGGVTLQRLGQVLESGFRRVAVSGAIWRVDDVAAELSAFKKQLIRDE